MIGKKFKKFAITGVGSTSIHIIVAWFLIDHLTVSPAFANGIAFLLATLFSCTVNTVWTFSAPWQLGSMTRFIAVTFAALLLSMGIAQIADLLGLPPAAGILAIVSIIPVITFFLHNSWTYR